MVATCTDAGRNVHRWCQPGVARYSRPDPLGLPEPLDFDDSDVNLFGYAVNNPLFNTDPVREISLPWDPEVPRRCRKRWRNKILPRLQDLAQGENCQDFFCKELKTNLPQLISDVFPFIVVVQGSGGRVPFCPTGGAPGTIEVGKRSFCGSTEETLK